MLTECRLGLIRSFCAIAAAVAFLFVVAHAPAQEAASAPQASATASDDEWAPIDNADVQAPPANAEMPVIAPQLKSTRAMRPGGSPAPVKMATEVRYDDLDLKTPHGAKALRVRLHSASQDVCEQLAAAYPVYQMHLTSCEKTAEKNAGLQADRLIRNAGGI